MALRVALFVEGSTPPPSPRGLPALERIWNEHVADMLGVARFDPIVPISKKHLVAMDPEAPQMSGAAERLDQLLVRILKRKQFDAAIIAWDLVPAWNPEANFCRWSETLDLYRLLAGSTVLPASWIAEAQHRYNDLSNRPTNSTRLQPLQLRAGTIVALCMAPMFEGLLVQNEQAVRRALNLEGVPSPKGWPGWGHWKPDTLLTLAITSLKRARPRHQITRQIGGDFRTNKDGWGEYLLRKLLTDEQYRSDVLNHPIYQRLSEWLR